MVIDCIIRSHVLLIIESLPFYGQFSDIFLSSYLICRSAEGGRTLDRTVECMGTCLSVPPGQAGACAAGSVVPSSAVQGAGRGEECPWTLIKMTLPPVSSSSICLKHLSSHDSSSSQPFERHRVPLVDQ